MEFGIEGLILAILIWITSAVLVTLYICSRTEMQGQLPPGPRRWPVVGNLFQLGFSAHESFVELSRKYGPIMTLWLGSVCTVIISSDQVAQEMFKKHDVVLAGRKVREAMKGENDNHNEGSIAVSQYGPYWRMLRRLCATEIFVTSRLEATREVRHRCIDNMVKFIQEAAENGTQAIDISRFFFLMDFNLIGNLIFSKDLLDAKSEKGQKFFDHVGRALEFMGKPNVADHFRFLKWIDPQRIRKNVQFHVDSALEILKEFMRERAEINMDDKGNDDGKRKDYLNVLLEFRGDGVEEPSKFSSTSINHIIFEMFAAGTDTTTSTLEWAMAELLHNPKELNKVQAEIRNTIGPNKKVEEKDIEHLPYLKAVVKETLRLHPPFPLLIPHMAMDDCKILGYHIPKETQILVNTWAIGRDPKVWEDPLVFKPERFMGPNTVEYKGHHFEFIPFGAGRRMCPAMPLVSRLLPLTLGSVLYCFDWVLAYGIKAEEMDMSERLGITLRKSIPLKAIPVPYNHIS